VAEVQTDPVSPQRHLLAANPELHGKSTLEILDAAARLLDVG